MYNREAIAQEIADAYWCPEREVVEEATGFNITLSMFIPNSRIDDYIHEQRQCAQEAAEDGRKEESKINRETV